MAKFFTRVLLAASLILAVATATRAEIGISDNEVLVGSSNILSGPSGFYGVQTNLGIQTYFNSVNEQGGVYGRKLRLISEDDKYDPETAIACFQRLVQSGVFGVTSFDGSAMAAKYIPMCMNNKMPALGFYAGAQFITNPVKHYIFATRATYHDEMNATIENLWKIGIRKFGVIYQNDAYGADCLEGVKQALSKHNSAPVATGSYTRNVNNVADAVSQVKAAGPEAVIVAAVFKPSAEVLKLAAESKWNPIFCMNSGALAEKVAQEGGAAADNEVISDVNPFAFQTDRRIVSEYRKALQKYFPKETPNSSSMKGYINAMIFVQGLKRAGKDLSRENFINALESMRNDDLGLGEGMMVSYSATNHVPYHRVFFATFKNGSVVPLADWKNLQRKI